MNHYTIRFIHIFFQNFSYDDLFKVAELWDKVTAVTTTGNNQNIVFLYDPFVAAVLFAFLL